MQRLVAFASLGVSVSQHWTTCDDCKEGFVMGGADVVHYWGLHEDDDVQELGTEDHATEYRGFKFLFRNASNVETFLSNPEKYVPAYGGF